MLRLRLRGIAIAAMWVVVSGVSLLAIAGKVASMRAGAGRVHAAIELGGAFGTAQRAALESGGTLHVRIEAAVWEDRTVFDRVVEAPRISTFRIVRNPNGTALAVIDREGRVATHKPYPDRLVLDVDVCAVSKLERDTKYYLEASVTIGSLGEDELDEATEAVFGRDDDPPGLKRVGRFLLNSVLQVKDYVGSVSTEIHGSRFTTAQLQQP